MTARGTSTEAIHVVGIGGIGCTIAHTLLSNGANVLCVETAQDKITWGQANGIRVGKAPARMAPFIEFARWSPPPEATVILCTKGPANRAVLARLPESINLIPIQNGIDSQLEGRAPFIEGIASFVSECPADTTHTRITRGGSLHLGIHGAVNDRLHDKLVQFANLLKPGPFHLQMVDDILPYKYTKLLYNAAIGPIASAAGLDNGELLRVPRMRSLFFALLRENYAILRHAGLPLGKIGPLAPQTVSRILLRSWLAHLLSWAFYPSLAGTYCSMAKDLPGRPTEIDHYNGRLIELAGTFPCPINRAVYHLIRQMEKDHLPPSMERIYELERLLPEKGRPASTFPARI